MSGIFERIGIDVGIVVMALIIIIIGMLIFIMKLQLQMDRLNRKYRIFMKGTEGQSIEKMIQRKLGQLDKVQDINEDHGKMIKKIQGIQDNTMNKYGVVKYDAFDDVGGKLSFALAMLNKNDTGIVLNAVHSRDNCFLYIKEIMNGESYIMLSEEEIEALRIAKGTRDN